MARSIDPPSDRPDYKHRSPATPANERILEVLKEWTKAPKLRTRAIIVGCDEYKHRPLTLTASVNDALEIRKVLIELEIVRPGECTLFTAPATPDALGKPDSATLRKHLLEARDNTGNYDRLIVFFSGHGEMTFRDVDASLPRTVILPCDYDGTPALRFLNIDVDELLDQFRLAGPSEQIFIFDCCREQAKEIGKHSGGGPLQWDAPATSGPERAQSALYGVALKGIARAEVGKVGFMTKHIVSGLRGAALDYVEDEGLFAVTIESLTKHVQEEVRLELKGREQEWEAKYDLPTLVPRGPRTSAFTKKDRDQVSTRPLTIFIEPTEAIQSARVSLEASGMELRAWPPNGETYQVMPTSYGVRSFVIDRSSGFVAPEFETVDVRKVSQRSVKFSRAGAQVEAGDLPSAAAVSDEREDVFKRLELRFGAASAVKLPIPAPDSGKGLLVASAVADSFAYVEIIGQQPPYQRASGFPSYDPNPGVAKFEVEVTAGLYEVLFRLGSEIFSRAEVAVRKGGVVLVEAKAGASPLIIDTMPDRFSQQGVLTETGQISESIGDLQGGVVATLLPALAMRPFDLENQFLSHSPVDVRLPHALWPRHPLSLVVGIDGSLGDRESTWDALFGDAKLVLRRLGDALDIRPEVIKLQRFSDSFDRPGFNRFANAIVEVPSANLPSRSKPHSSHFQSHSSLLHYLSV